jgi:hypothetical protein
VPFQLFSLFLQGFPLVYYAAFACQYELALLLLEQNRDLVPGFFIFAQHYDQKYKMLEVGHIPLSSIAAFAHLYLNSPSSQFLFLSRY